MALFANPLIDSSFRKRGHKYVCDAAVCLVGKLFVRAPEDEPDRSYTQREYDCAKKLGKPIFVYLADDAFYLGDDPPQSQQARVASARCRQESCYLELSEIALARILHPRRVASSKHRRKVGRHSRNALPVRQSVISSSSRLR